jgi:hypothetical protein
MGTNVGFRQKGTEVLVCDDACGHGTRSVLPGFCTSSTCVVPNTWGTSTKLSTVCTAVNAVVLILLKPKIQGITLREITVPQPTQRYASMEAPAADCRKREGVA